MSYDIASWATNRDTTVLGFFNYYLFDCRCYFKQSQKFLILKNLD